MVLLNILVAIGLVYLGFHLCAWLVAVFIIDNSEAEILATIRRIKKEAEDAVNDN